MELLISRELIMELNRTLFITSGTFLINLLFIYLGKAEKVSRSSSSSSSSGIQFQFQNNTLDLKTENLLLLERRGESYLLFHENLENLTRLRRQVDFEDPSKYRKKFGIGYQGGNKYYGGHNGDEDGFSYEDPPYQGGGGGGWGSPLVPKKKKGYKPIINPVNNNHHYDPSINKYGGGGPISHGHGIGKGGPTKAKPNYGSSYVPNHILPLRPNNNNVPGKRIPGGYGGYGGGGGNHIPSVPPPPPPPPQGNDNGLVPYNPPPPPPPNDSSTAVTLVVCTFKEKCHTFLQCASHSSDFLRSKDRCCLQPGRISGKGMCCEGPYASSNPPGRHFSPYPTDTVSVPDLSEGQIQAGAREGYEYLTTLNEIEARLSKFGIFVQRGTSSHGHLLLFQTTSGIINAARDNFLTLKATNFIQERYLLSKAEAGIGLQGYDFQGTVFEQSCPSQPKCNRYDRYRTIDGSCNNPTSTRLGQSSTPLIRLLPPDYADGIWAPRVSRDGSPLPNSRFITLNLDPDANMPDLRYSHMLMQFGQFVDHDLSHVPIIRFPDFKGVECCSNVQSDVTHPACLPISIPPNDYINRGRRCMNFVRSMTAPRLDCSFGHADQLNQITHWLDMSQIYGSTFEQSESLREFSGGRLRISEEGNREFLPEDGNGQSCTQQGNSGGDEGHCFVSGDLRVNEQISLASVHTIFHREHNRVANDLSKINGHWDDETLYQETRRIVTAEYQHIIYNEFLPILIGRKYMETFGILPLYDGYYDGYDASVDARISNAFTTAAYRLHTLVQGTLSLQVNGGRTVGRLVLRDVFNNPSILPEGGALDLVTEGLLNQPIQRFDPYITTELRDHLFETATSPGLDLIAINIQRGRDHGLPGYNEYRDLCRLGKARDFGDLAPIIHPRKISQLERVYENVDDIDLYIGGLHETPLPGALVGPTFACIIGDQFVRLKRGDRFFYDVKGQIHSFSPAQLHEIRSASFSRILCDNTDEIRSIQPLAFHLPNRAYNPVLPCATLAIPRLDLRAWTE